MPLESSREKICPHKEADPVDLPLGPVEMMNIPAALTKWSTFPFSVFVRALSWPPQSCTQCPLPGPHIGQRALRSSAVDRSEFDSIPRSACPANQSSSSIFFKSVISRSPRVKENSVIQYRRPVLGQTQKLRPSVDSVPAGAIYYDILDSLGRYRALQAVDRGLAILGYLVPDLQMHAPSVAWPRELA